MRRFVELRNGVEWLVLDCKNPNAPLVVCKCDGFQAPLNSSYVADALEAYHRNLINMLCGGEDGTGDTGC